MNIECLDAYFPLDAREMVEYERVLTQEPFRETKSTITSMINDLHLTE